MLVLKLCSIQYLVPDVESKASRFWPDQPNPLNWDGHHIRPKKVLDKILQSFYTKRVVHFEEPGQLCLSSELDLIYLEQATKGKNNLQKKNIVFCLRKKQLGNFNT